MRKSLKILGTRGIPARHGGFETFAEDLALRLSASGWRVTVYCQEEGPRAVRETTWNGVRLVHVAVERRGAVGTIEFDWLATRHAAKEGGQTLTLGYNTAVFCSLLRWAGNANLINMDGLEWRRSKYGPAQRAWLWINEIMGSWLGNHLIADHPEIARHLTWWTRGKKITTIPYGSRPVEAGDKARIEKLGLAPGGYALVIARPEPENSVQEIVKAFSEKKRNCRLVVLGEYLPDERPYHRKVMEGAGPEVLFPGAIYEKETVDSLRFFARLYIHGHSVGGTNPSLVEAMAAGNAVLAHDNRFNRWVAGEMASYFVDQNTCAEQLDALLDNEEELRSMGDWSRRRWAERFTLDHCLDEYETLLGRWTGIGKPDSSAPVE